MDWARTCGLRYRLDLTSGVDEVGLWSEVLWIGRTCSLFAVSEVELVV